MPKVDMKFIFKTDRGQDVTITIPNVEADCEIESIGREWAATSTWYGVLLRNHKEERYE